MGLVHTTRYLDFPHDSWKQISVNPTVFETIIDNAVLEICNTSHKEQKLIFKKGGELELTIYNSNFNLLKFSEIPEPLFKLVYISAAKS